MQTSAGAQLAERPWWVSAVFLSGFNSATCHGV